MEASETSARPGAFRILGTSFGLLVLLALLLLTGSRLIARPVDGAAKASEYFGSRPPFGLELADAVRLPTQDVLLRFERPGGAAPAPGEPVDVLLLEYQSAAAVEGVFFITVPEGGDISMRLKEWEKDPSTDWHATLKKDDIAWGTWRSKYLIERAFEQGGGWRDEVRVDLSQKGRAVVLFAHWPEKTPVDEAKLKELLGTIVMKPSEES